MSRRRPGHPRGLLPWGPGKEMALPPPPPLRTARESFPSCSSSLHERPSQDAAALQQLEVNSEHLRQADGRSWSDGGQNARPLPCQVNTDGSPFSLRSPVFPQPDASDPSNNTASKNLCQKAEFRSNSCRYSSMSLPALIVGSPAVSAPSNCCRSSVERCRSPSRDLTRVATRLTGDRVATQAEQPS